MSVKVTITGDKELINSLKKLPKLVARKCLRQAMRPAMKLVQTAAKNNAPVKTGLTQKAIKVRALRRSTKFIGIDVQIGEGDYKGKTFYGAFLEYGTKERFHKAGKGQTMVAAGYGKIEPHEFMKDAYKSVGETAKAYAIRKLKELIEEANNK